MAVTVTTVLDGVDTHIADITATADADTTATIPHGMVTQEASKPGRGGVAGAGVIPLEVTLVNLQQVGGALSAWAATTINATNVVLTKSTAVGSGVAGAQVRCIIKKPNTIGR